MKDFHQILNLARSLVDTATKKERIEKNTDLSLLKKEDKNHIIDNLTNLDKKNARKILAHNFSKSKENDWQTIKQVVKPQQKLHLLKPLLRIAAVFIGVIGLSYFFLNGNLFNSQDTFITIEENDITLELDNGTIEIIKPNGEKTILNKQGKIVATKDKGILNYVNRNTSTLVSPIKKKAIGTYKQKEIALKQKDLIAYNELHIPYGKTYKLVLSDGTLVHLNAGSSLKYPIKFIPGLQRKVFLKGEALFDVVKNKEQPFVVNSKDIDIKVYGTLFNVSSYSEDEAINTVLVHGSVGVTPSKKTEKNQQQKIQILKPGQLGAWNKKEKKIAVTNVNTKIHTAWAEGKLLFKKMSFKLIRKKLERHYNVIIKNNNTQLDQKIYNASFEVETIEEVLASFRKNYAIEYTIENNQIIIN